MKKNAFPVRDFNKWFRCGIVYVMMSDVMISDVYV